MDIIKVGLYLLSCLQKNIGLTFGASKQVVVTDEKGIFYGAVLARERHLFYINLILNRQRAAERQSKCFSCGSFVFVRIIYAIVVADKVDRRSRRKENI